MTKKDTEKKKGVILLWIAGLLLIAGIISGIYFVERETQKVSLENLMESESREDTVAKNKERVDNDTKGNQVNENELDQASKDILIKADVLAEGYFYEDAIKLLSELNSELIEHKVIKDNIKKYETQKSLLTPYTGNVPHIFFHSLIVDTDKAFDGDSMSKGYNYWMTTVSEFKKMLEELHKNDYILVSIYDLFTIKTDSEGNNVYESKSPLLPPGKKPFVLSIDDLNYYEYMEEDGFAKRLVLDENNNVTCIYEDNDAKKTGDYDVVPILESFIKEHPDFSYQGAKGIIAVTGYEGALGYRTNLMESPTYEEDKQEVKKIATRLTETGWNFAVHGYWHQSANTISLEALTRDTTKWKEQVESLVGATDIYIYPYGEEIDYPSKKLDYLQSEGFKVFCGVWSKDFLLVEKNYVRQTRRNLDGYSMHYRPERLADLFTVQNVMDPSRPEFE